jgi:hypothetical protein
LFFEVVEPFFSWRLHPNTSLRECVRPSGRPSRSVGDLAPRILLRPSRAAWPSQSGLRSAWMAESKWHLRLALPARASSARGRADATVDPWLCAGSFASARQGSPGQLFGSGVEAAAGPTRRRGLPPWNGKEGRGSRGRGLVPLVAGTMPAKVPHGCLGANPPSPLSSCQGSCLAYAVFLRSFCRGGPPGR